MNGFREHFVAHFVDAIGRQSIKCETKGATKEWRQEKERQMSKLKRRVRALGRQDASLKFAMKLVRMVRRSQSSPIKFAVTFGGRYQMGVVLTFILAAFAFLSCGLSVWQWNVGRRFPLHQRVADSSFCPPVTLLKPLKGSDRETEGCLRSWFEQAYGGPVQILFGVASEADPVCRVVRQLIKRYPGVDAQLLICSQLLGTNAKVSTLTQLHASATHEAVVISDADVWAPADLLTNAVAPLRDPGVGLVNCFYQLVSHATVAMEWEAIAINADFWSQVLQSQSLKPLDFALGAVMATTRRQLDGMGRFEALLDYLADDYQLGHKIARNGASIVLCPVVAECRSEPMGWKSVWIHQLRWARTIRVCQPGPFLLSILSNATLWPLLWAVVDRTVLAWSCAAGFGLVRVLTARSNYHRLAMQPLRWSRGWLVLLKDLLGVVIWALAFAGNEVQWRGRRFRMRRDGRLEACA